MELTSPSIESLEKPRRNVLICSFILTSLSLGKVSIMKVSLAGMDFSVGSPKVIFALLWSLFFYFLLRFIQHLFQGNIFKYLADEFQGTLNVDEIMVKIIENKINQKYYGSNIAEDYELPPIFKNLKTLVPFLIYQYQPILKRTKIKNQTLENVKVGFGFCDINFSIRIALALLGMFAIRTRFTDYFFPLLFAIFVTLYAGFGNWDGNFKALFSFK